MPQLVIGAWETGSQIGNGFRPYGLGINMATKILARRIPLIRGRGQVER